MYRDRSNILDLERIYVTTHLKNFVFTTRPENFIITKLSSSISSSLQIDDLRSPTAHPYIYRIVLHISWQHLHMIVNCQWTTLHVIRRKCYEGPGPLRGTSHHVVKPDSLWGYMSSNQTFSRIYSLSGLVLGYMLKTTNREDNILQVQLGMNIFTNNLHVICILTTGRVSDSSKLSKSWNRQKL